MDKLTYKEKMEREGWHNVYNEEPAEPGEYIICRRNGSTGHAQYLGNGLRHNDSSGWEITWWK